MRSGKFYILAILTLGAAAISGATIWHDHAPQCTPSVLRYRLTMGAGWLRGQCGRDSVCANKFAPDVVAGLDLDLSSCTEQDHAAIYEDVAREAVTWDQ